MSVLPRQIVPPPAAAIACAVQYSTYIYKKRRRRGHARDEIRSLALARIATQRGTAPAAPADALIRAIGSLCLSIDRRSVLS